MSHTKPKAETAAGPVDDAHVMQFWNAVERVAPEAMDELLQTADVDAWARKRNLTHNGAVPDWVIQSAEAIRRDCQAHGVDHCPPGPPVAGTRALTSGVTFSGPASDPDHWIKVEARHRVHPFYQRSKTQRKDIREAILRDIGKQIDASFKRIARSFQPMGPWKDAQHVERFVRYQVNETPVRDIVSQYCPSRETSKRKEWSDCIRIGLRRVAGLLGLDLATKPSGRPPRSN